MSAPPFGVSDGRCGRCRGQRLRFDAVLRAGAYRGVLRTLLQRFKFGGQEDLANLFVGPLVRAILRSEFYEDIDTVVAVPTCWQHRLLQRFYPATVLAKQVAKSSRIPYAALLDRVAAGPRQTLLAETERRRNVRGKFRLARGCMVTGARICLVDDVMTTGSTVAECSRVLKKSGAAKVYVAIVARAGDDFASANAD
jgi:ComF family protein